MGDSNRNAADRATQPGRGDGEHDTRVVTIFADKSAQTKREVPLASFLNEILVNPPNAASKLARPMCSGAAYGTRRSKKNALRFNANVLRIDAVTGD